MTAGSEGVVHCFGLAAAGQRRFTGDRCDIVLVRGKRMTVLSLFLGWAETQEVFAVYRVGC